MHLMNCIKKEKESYSELSARIASYDLAYQLHTSAPEALNISSENEQTKRLYGLHMGKGEHKLSIPTSHFGRQCLIARRLVERGVRFVQLYSGGGHQQQNWDAHNGAEENLKIHGPEIDVPIAGLLEDLDRRGMLEETLVVWEANLDVNLYHRETTVVVIIIQRDSVISLQEVELKLEPVMERLIH